MTKCKVPYPPHADRELPFRVRFCKQYLPSARSRLFQEKKHHKGIEPNTNDIGFNQCRSVGGTHVKVRGFT